MLTATDFARGTETPLFSGGELGASGQIERLQQALLALSKTGLPLANPGPVSGVMTNQTVIASLYAIFKGGVAISSLTKAGLLALAWDAAPAVGGEVTSFLSGPADQALATLKSTLESLAPTLTTAIALATQQRSGQSTTPTSPAGDSLRERLLASRGRTMDQQAFAPPPHEEGAIGPGAKGFIPSTAGPGKAGTYALIGLGVLAVGGLGWWLLR
jgi:hypothetical protein